MAEQPEQDVDLQRLRDAVREAVQSGANLQRQVRDLMLTAFSAGHLDLSVMRRVTSTTLEGIGTAANVRGDRAREVIRQSVAGVEEALLQAAEASKLAIQEAAGRSAEFSRNDLAKALADLGAIEELFMDTLGEVASAGSRTAAVVFGDFLDHFRNSGTAIGRHLADTMTGFGEDLPQAAGEGLQKGFDMARTTADRLARFASGFLSGIEQGLASAAKDTGGGGPEEQGPD